MPVKKIATSELEIGMYVSSLDRPWNETRFEFQGVEIRNATDIQQLQAISQHVYVIVPDEEIELHGTRSPDEITPVDSDLFGRETYTVRMEASDEVEAVRSAHNRVADLVGDLDRLADTEGELPLEQLNDAADIMVGSLTSNPDAFVWLTQIKRFDSYLYRDSLSCAVRGTAIGCGLGMDKENLRKLALGILLMDLGKTRVPKELLYKRTRLSPGEWDQMKSHVSHGLNLVERMPGIPPEVPALIKTHHERIDGSGYPEGLRGSQIPVFGQIAGIVDFYVAVTTPRPYAPVISPSAAINMLYQQKGKYFDDTLVQAFINVLSTYPTGSLVELNSHDIGIVLSQTSGLRLKPKIMLLLDENKRPYGSNPIVNLANGEVGRDGNPLLIVKTLADGVHGLHVDELLH